MLDIQNLSVVFSLCDRQVQAIDALTLSLQAGETLAIVGQSGSGKSTLCRAIMGLLAQNAHATGRIMLDQTDLLALSDREKTAYRGRRIAMVMQDPMTALNPCFSVGEQIAQAVRIADPTADKSTVRAQVLTLLEQVGIEHATARVEQYPHQFSGGMRQRIVIAMALASRADILLCDEPTTALDVTTQSQLLALLQHIKQTQHKSLLLISHDLGVVARMADRVAVMKDGKMVECNDVFALFSKPQHPYTKRLLQALPSTEAPEKNTGHHHALVEVNGLSKQFTLADGTRFSAVDEVSFHMHDCEILALVGESGSGKTTLAHCLMGLCQQDSGQILFDDLDLSLPVARRQHRRRVQSEIQLVFQNATASLNPKMTVQGLLFEPLRLQKWGDQSTRHARVQQCLVDVGLDDSLLNRLPSQLSGGQRQRVAIARALCLNPRLVIADEPISSLDLATQTQMIELFRRLQQQYGFSLLLVTHDLSVVRSLSDRVAVMCRGKMVEVGATADICNQPLHRYTQALIQSAPIADPVLERQKPPVLDVKTTTPQGQLRLVSADHWVLMDEEGAR